MELSTRYASRHLRWYYSVTRRKFRSAQEYVDERKCIVTATPKDSSISSELFNSDKACLK